MSIQQLFDILLRNEPLPRKLLDALFSNKLKDYLAPLILRHQYRKGQVLLSAGQAANQLYFLENGIMRGYYLHPVTNKELTHYLWNGHSLITDPESYFLRTESIITIETLTPVKLHSLSIENFLAAVKVFPVLELFSRNVLLQYLTYERKRSQELVCLAAWDRYLRFLETFPSAERYIQKEIIASYLNITPQSLSRMLREKGHP